MQANYALNVMFIKVLHCNLFYVINSFNFLNFNILLKINLNFHNINIVLEIVSPFPLNMHILCFLNFPLNLYFYLFG